MKSTSGPTVVTDNEDDTAYSYSIYPRYSGTLSQLFGVVQVIGGIAAITLQSILFSSDSVARYAGAGIWAGVLLIVTGCFGVFTGKFKTKCLIVTYMALTISAAVISCVGITISSLFGIFMDNDPSPEAAQYCEAGDDGCTDADTASSYLDVYNNPHTLNYILVVIAVVELFTLTWASALCCYATCNQGGGEDKIRTINGKSVMVHGSSPADAIPPTPTGLIADLHAMLGMW